MDRAELARLGIEHEMLLDAVEEAGGAINISGQYPISEAIRRRLEAVLGSKESI